jgi:hypothetical protein
MFYLSRVPYHPIYQETGSVLGDPSIASYPWAYVHYFPLHYTFSNLDVKKACSYSEAMTAADGQDSSFQSLTCPCIFATSCIAELGRPPTFRYVTA